MLNFKIDNVDSRNTKRVTIEFDFSMRILTEKFRVVIVAKNYFELTMQLQMELNPAQCIGVEVAVVSVDSINAAVKRQLETRKF